MNLKIVYKKKYLYFITLMNNSSYEPIFKY